MAKLGGEKPMTKRKRKRKRLKQEFTCYYIRYLVIPFVLSNFSSKNLNTASCSVTFESQLVYPESDVTVPITSLHLDGIVDGMQVNEIHRDV